MNNPLAKKFNVLSLLRFALPTTVMMMFMSLYTMIDGVFVSNFVGKHALSAINIAYPAISIVVATGIMLASGGSAVIAKNMGQGQHEKARENFSMLVAVGIVTGVVLGFIGFVFTDPLLRLLGSTDSLHDYGFWYLRILALFTPLSILQMLFQFFFVTAGKPQLGLFVTIAGGLANIVLDYVFIVPFNMGIAGAALATGIGYSIPAIAGLCFFTFHKKGSLYFVRPKRNRHVLLQSCLNGSSEMVTNLATAITTFLFNIVTLKLLKEDGVAAITIVLYSQFLLTAIYLGFSSGVAPVISYNYGSENNAELKKLFKICLRFIIITSFVIFVLSLLLCSNIISIFVRKDSEVFSIASHGFLLFSFSYLFSGVNIFASSLFTAFSNGLISALISFLRTFIFITAGILLLPNMIGIDGIWLAVPIAELFSLLVSGYFLFKYRKSYHYV